MIKHSRCQTQQTVQIAGISYVVRFVMKEHSTNQCAHFAKNQWLAFSLVTETFQCIALNAGGEISGIPVIMERNLTHQDHSLSK